MGHVPLGPTYGDIPAVNLLVQVGSEKIAPLLMLLKYTVLGWAIIRNIFSIDNPAKLEKANFFAIVNKK